MTETWEFHTTWDFHTTWEFTRPELRRLKPWNSTLPGIPTLLGIFISLKQVWRASGWCLDGVWMVSGWCLDGVLFWFVPNLKVLEAGGCLEGVWTVSRLPNFNFLFSVKVVVVLVLVLVTS